MSDRTDFRLPGHILNSASQRRCVLSLLSAFSRQWNPRNLESLWYDPWAQILSDLVANHPSLSVAPQPFLWYDTSTSAEPHTTPGPAHHLSSHDEEMDFSFDDVGNITLDSIRSISIPHHRSRSRIPDFAITRKVSLPRSNNNIPLPHLDRKVTYVGIPLLVELKTSGARCHDIQTSLLNSIKPMNLARDQLYKQAYHLFQMYPHQDSVMLVAVSGFWWSYSIFSRGVALQFDAPSEEEDEDEEEDVDEEGDTRLPLQNGIHSIPEEDPLYSNEMPIQALQENLYGFPLRSLQEIPGHPEVHYHDVLPPGQVRLYEEGWSGYLLYGTAPSNQVLSLILDRLHSIVHVHYDGRMG